MGQREYSRSIRVAERIQREVALLLAHEIADPRIGEVTVSGVDLSPDMRRAKVLITPGRTTDGDAAASALNRAAGFLRSRLASRIRLRYLPRLEFEHDLTLERALRIDTLLQGVDLDPSEKAPAEESQASS